MNTYMNVSSNTTLIIKDEDEQKYYFDYYYLSKFFMLQKNISLNKFINMIIVYFNIKL